jgi:hypothetical protein
VASDVSRAAESCAPKPVINAVTDPLTYAALPAVVPYTPRSQGPVIVSGEFISWAGLYAAGVGYSWISSFGWLVEKVHTRPLAPGAAEGSSALTVTPRTVPT